MEVDVVFSPLPSFTIIPPLSLNSLSRHSILVFSLPRSDPPSSLPSMMILIPTSGIIPPIPPSVFSLSFSLPSHSILPPPGPLSLICVNKYFVTRIL